MHNAKVSIIGSGAVGSTLAYTLFLNPTVKEIVLIDKNLAKAEGDVLDIGDGNSLSSHPKVIRAGDYKDIKGSKIVVISAGAAQGPNETRMDLLKKNAAIIASVAESLKPHLAKDMVILVLSNPVDVLTAYLTKLLPLPPSQIVGSGTVLDTMRLKGLIAEALAVDPRNVHTYVLGEHGDTEVPIYSLTKIGGLSLEEYLGCSSDCEALKASLKEKVRDRAYQIIEKKGATNYAVALAANRLVSSILNDERSVLPLSVPLDGLFEGRLAGSRMSLPCVLGAKGIEKILEPRYSPDELRALSLSGAAIKEKLAGV